MRTVADTNTVVSGLLWQGSPRQVMDAARTAKIDLFTSGALLAEIEEVLLREKFSERLEKLGLSSRDLVIGYAALATVVVTATIDPVILDDPDDDEVLACAAAADAEIVVSGDSHLLNLKEYKGIDIITAAELLIRI